MANQNKSFLLLKLLDDCFLWNILLGIHYHWKAQYLIIWIARSSHSQVLKNLLNCGKLYERYIFLEYEKIVRTSIFLSTSEGMLLNIAETRSLLLWSFIFSISHFSALETECTDAAVCSCFSKYLKILQYYFSLYSFWFAENVFCFGLI